MSEREAAGLHHRRVPVEITEDTVFPATGTGFRATRHRQVLLAAPEGNTTHRPPSTPRPASAIVGRGGYTVGNWSGIAQAARRVTNNTTNGRRNYNTTTNKSYNTNNTYNRNNNRIPYTHHNKSNHNSGVKLSAEEAARRSRTPSLNK